MKNLLLLTFLFISLTCFSGARKRTAIYDTQTITIMLEQSKYDIVCDFDSNLDGIIIYYLSPSGIYSYLFNPDYFFKRRFKNRRKNQPVSLKLRQSEKDYLQKIYDEHKKGMGDINSSDVFSIIVHN